MNRFSLFFLLIFSSASFATTTMTGFEGASNVSGLGVAGQAITVYAGMAGTCSGANCDSCAAAACGTAPFCACNTNRISDASSLRITFVTDYATVSGTTILYFSNPAGNPVTAFGQYTGANQTQTITTTWGALCLAAFGDTCENSAGSANQVIKIGVSNNTQMVDWVNVTVSLLIGGDDVIDDCTGSTGSLCSWRAYPGDEVVYIKNPVGDVGYPGTTTGIRVYVSNSGFANASPTGAIKTQDITLGSDGSLSDNIIDGLDNLPAVPYSFRIAAMDAAKNVYGFTSDTNITNADGGACTSTADTDIKGTCRYIAKPDQVFGILAKDMNCFIATAAYGSSMEPKINTFREFRSRYLLLNPWGRKFVDSYYHWGPYAAQWIADREWARTVSRGLLWPFWGYATFANSMGIERATVLCFMSLVMLVAGLVALTSFGRKFWTR